jgi:sugar lactone lactonase YvrE
MSLQRLLLAALVASPVVVAPLAAVGHPGHDHRDQFVATEATPPSAPMNDAITGTGDLRFRYRPDLSELPENIAKGIKKAHGGFAKTPDGDIYFGLEGTGLIRLSADLKTKTLVSDSDDMKGGALHNTTYIKKDGDLLILPDPARGRVYAVTLEGKTVATIGRPQVNDYYKNPDNAYRPTDADLATDNVLYICDGYSPGKYVLAADLEEQKFFDRYYGGAVEGKGRQEGKYSTNHGVTFDPNDATLLIADRERQWIQRMTLTGEFVEGFDTAGGDVCDVDFVEWQGERLIVAGCLKSGAGAEPGFVAILRDGKVVSTLKPKVDLGIEEFQHIHNAAGVVVDGKLFVLCYGWNPGCYAVLEHIAE